MEAATAVSAQGLSSADPRAPSHFLQVPEPEGSSNSDDTVMDAAPAHVLEAPPADPMALDNFRLSEAVKQQLRAKKIETLFPIQVNRQGSQGSADTICPERPSTLSLHAS